MNWGDERYVRVYTRDTTNWLCWSWQARALFLLLLRKADRTGTLDLGKHGKHGICAHVGMPWDVAEPALEELIRDACIAYHESNAVDATSTARNAKSSWLSVRNYVDAQESIASPAKRQRDWRARRNEMSTAVDAPSTVVDAVRRGETRRDSVPIRSVPNHPSRAYPEEGSAISALRPPAPVDNFLGTTSSPPTPKTPAAEVRHASPDAARVAEYLFEAIRSHNPGQRGGPRAVAKSARDVDLALRIDHRTTSQLTEAIDFAHCPPHRFWSSQILCGAKLREKFDELAIDMRNRTPSNGRLVRNSAEELYQRALDMEKREGRTT